MSLRSNILRKKSIFPLKYAQISDFFGHIVYFFHIMLRKWKYTYLIRISRNLRQISILIKKKYAPGTLIMLDFELIPNRKYFIEFSFISVILFYV